MRPSVCLCPLTELQIYWSVQSLGKEDDQILVFHLKPDKDLDAEISFHFLEHCRQGWESAVTLLLLFVIKLPCMHYWQFVRGKRVLLRLIILSQSLTTPIVIVTILTKHLTVTFMPTTLSDTGISSIIHTNLCHPCYPHVKTCETKKTWKVTGLTVTGLTISNLFANC